MSRNTCRVAVCLGVLSLVLTGCGEKKSRQPTRLHKPKPALRAIVSFTAAETRVLREFKIAIYRNRIIRHAQPPITDAQLQQVQALVSGEIPPDLVALWRVAFGGELDYRFFIDFDGFLYPASMAELFYPGSKHYHDLDGWIEHESEMWRSSSSSAAKIPFIPFGGFEYLDRAYAVTQADKYGQVYYYAQGLPPSWKGRLTTDSFGLAANSVADLFDRLALDENPFQSEDEFARGKEAVKLIEEIGSEHPELAAKLRKLLEASVVDWRAIVRGTDFTKRISEQQIDAVRTALRLAAERNDFTIIQELRKAHAPFDLTISGRYGVVPNALVKESHELVEKILAAELIVGDSTIVHAEGCSDELLQRLVEEEFSFDIEAAYSAAESGSIDGAVAVVNGGSVDLGTKQIIVDAEDRAKRKETDAKKVEDGSLSSYLTPAQYRVRARNLREFAARLSKIR